MTEDKTIELDELLDIHSKKVDEHITNFDPDNRDAYQTTIMDVMRVRKGNRKLDNEKLSKKLKQLVVKAGKLLMMNKES